MKYAIVGASGQLGSALVRAAEAHGHTVARICHASNEYRRDRLIGQTYLTDVTSERGLANVLESSRPDVVVNTAALHNVGLCEERPSIAFLINAIGSRNVARACKNVGALHIGISTDYVFGGRPPELCRGYSPDDPPAALNLYGWTKAVGESLARLEWERTAIVRIAYLFGRGGSKQKNGNFVDKVLAQLDRGETVERPNDTFVSPTYAADAAEAILAIHEPGIYHATNLGSVSLFAFAVAIAQMAGFPADRVQSSAEGIDDGFLRPKFSVLLPSPNLPFPRQWFLALEDYLKEIGRYAPK